MSEYPKIQTVYKRPAANPKKVDVGDFSLPEFAFLARCEWIWTEKVDGTNVRILWDPALGMRIGGRSDAAMIPPRLLDAIHGLDLPTKLPGVFDGPAVLYGEGYGARIQKGGGNYRPDNGFVLFDVRVGDWWLTRANIEDVAAKLGIEVVPVVGAGDLCHLTEVVAAGLQSAWGSFPAEGIVARPAVELRCRNGERVITKLKTRDF